MVSIIIMASIESILSKSMKLVPLVNHCKHRCFLRGNEALNLRIATIGQSEDVSNLLNFCLLSY